MFTRDCNPSNEICSWRKETVHHRNWMKLQSGGFSQQNLPRIIVNHMLTFFSWFGVFFMWWSRFVNTHVKSTLFLMSSAGCSLRFLSPRCSYGSRVYEKHISWFIAICWLFVWSVKFVTWCSFTGQGDVTEVAVADQFDVYRNTVQSL